MEQAVLNLETFESHIGESFAVQVSDATFTLVLDEAEALHRSAREGGGFSLIFKSDPSLYLPQAMYALDHPQIGTADVFLVPLQPDGRGSLFQAVFN